MREFEAGQIWRSPRWYNYLVVSVDGHQATLRMGEDGSGRIMRRRVDATSGWTELLLSPKSRSDSQ